MNYLDLKYFILFMWAIVMVACIFIISIISPLSKLHIGEENPFTILKVSFIQAILAILIVLGLIFLLNKVKKIYLYKKIQGRNRI
jgi:hypothetical protein